MTSPAEPATPSRAAKFAGWRILALATIALGFTGPGQTIGVSVFIDRFADDLNLSKNAISAGYAVGTLTGSLMLPTIGRWIDRYGVRRAMLAIACSFSLAVAAMSGVQGILSLTAGFIFIRMLGQGSLSLVSTVAVSLWFERRRGLALGIAMTISSAMMALVPVALSFVIDEWGWRDAWLVAAGAVAVVVIPIAAFGMVDRPSTIGQEPDGGSHEPHRSRTPDVPSVDRATALRTRAFWILTVTTVTVSMLGTALNFHQIALLGESGFSETQAAVMFLPQVIGTSIGSPVMGYALDRLGSRWAPLATLVMLTITLIMAGTVRTTPAVIAYAVVFGLGAGASRTLGAALIPAWFGTAHIGSIQGALTFAGVLGSAAGPIAFSLTESATGGFRAAALIWAAAPLAGAVFASSKRPTPQAQS